MSHGRRTSFFTGTLIEPDDLRLEQQYLRGRSRTIELELSENGDVELWTEVSELAGSAPDDAHFVLDRETGRVTFGDGEHGKRPAVGSRVTASYGCGSARAAWLAIPFAAGVAGVLAALLRHRRS